MTLRSRPEILRILAVPRSATVTRDRAVARHLVRAGYGLACALTLGCGGADSLRPDQTPGPGTTDSSQVRLRGPFTTIAACTPPTAPADATLSIASDVVYSPGNGDAQRMDIVGPASASRRPMVLLIHGGGWRHGQRNDDSLRFTARVLAGEGFVAA